LTPNIFKLKVRKLKTPQTMNTTSEKCQKGKPGISNPNRMNKAKENHTKAVKKYENLYDIYWILERKLLQNIITFSRKI
jgi:hypothetical protein